LNEEEIRKTAIQRRLNGEYPKAMYTDIDWAKKWFFRWLKRYQLDQDDRDKGESKAPLQKLTQINHTERQRTISLRKRLQSESFAQVRVSAIKWELSKLGLFLLSDSAMNRISKSEGLIKKTSFMRTGNLIRFIRSGQELDSFGKKFEEPKRFSLLLC
jgi:hypothetical protein